MRLAKRYVRELASDMIRRNCFRNELADGMQTLYIERIVNACDNGLITSWEAVIELTKIIKEWSGNIE